MTTIHDVLSDLAEDAPEVMPDPGLWARGSRWHRVRRGGSVAIVLAACVLLLAVGLVSWRQSASPIRPAATGDAAALPSRLHDPSRWLPGTDEEGPLGAGLGCLHSGARLVVRCVDRLGGDLRNDEGSTASSTCPMPRSSVERSRSAPPTGVDLAYWITGDTQGSPAPTAGCRRGRRGVRHVHRRRTTPPGPDGRTVSLPGARSGRTTVGCCWSTPSGPRVTTAR